MLENEIVHPSHVPIHREGPPEFCNHLSCGAVLDPTVQAQCGIPPDDPLIAKCKSGGGGWWDDE